MPKLKQVSAEKYSTTELQGLQDILTFAKGDPTPISVVGFEDAKYGSKNDTKLFGSYGTNLQYIDEAFEFPNGNILVCATVSTWNGTFASHDSISVKYYGLEKK